MTREQLEKMNKQELKTICEENNIPHYHGKNIFRKGEMVEAILLSEEAVQTEGTADANTQSSVDTDDGSKVDRINNAPIGTLIAFYEPGTSKANTAKITNRNKKKGLIKCETQYGKEFIVPFDNIMWVKTGNRWPRGVYQLLKGTCDNGAEKV